MTTISPSNNPLMHFIHILLHNAEYILSGIFVWFSTTLAIKLPTILMLTFLLTLFDITHILPWMQAGVYGLAMVVSVVTLIKLAKDLKWFKKTK